VPVAGTLFSDLAPPKTANAAARDYRLFRHSRAGFAIRANQKHERRLPNLRANSLGRSARLTLRGDRAGV